MDEDLRVVDAPHADAPVDAPPEAPVEAPAEATAAPAGPKRRRVWLGRIGVVLVVLIAGVAVAFQVQVARVRNEVAAAESTQRIAELDRETARLRLSSVGDRRDIAVGNEADAQRVLDGSRQAMTAQGLEEASLHDAQVAKARQVKDLRAQVKAVHAAIAAQKRLQPAAGSCVFDLLRGLASNGAQDTAACRTVANGGAG